ncbi:hypothetical protein ASZ90_002493 [hydrocarbon metagenome]|uniref:Membrane iron-sulfur containing protein FtrD-like domain-containing protein n=1 Tax=hydrocarbon metagenome TaxID=938273 RepID=A0A0W8G3B2_9ZZZZ
MKKLLLSLALPAVVVTLAAVLDGPATARAFLGFGERHASVALRDGVVTIPLADVSGGTAKFYTVKVHGTDVRFFILTTPDGVTRSAFDACDVCYPARKGYEQDGPDMICRNCGLRFREDLVGEVRGGCNPSPLAHELADGTIRITEAALMEGLRYFPGGAS